MKYLFLNIFDWTIWKLYSDKVMKYLDWGNYETGFAGNGTSALDIKPSFDKPQLPKIVKLRLDNEIKRWAKIKQESFKKLCIEVLGENPDDWW